MRTRVEGRCLWLRQAIAPDEEDAPPLEGAQRADVAIVGGGYAGLWTALELKRRQPSLDVAILEADICGGGASGRNSGMVIAQWAKIAALEARCGVEGALRLGHAFAAAVAQIGSVCAEHGIDAEFRPDGWLWAATCARHVGSWNGILEALEARGLAPMRRVDAREIAAPAGSDRFWGGVHDPAAATVHPGKLVRGLRRLAIERGVRLHENAAMTALERRSPPVVRTARGSLTAERVILAMNAWSTALPELRPAILVIASDDAATQPAPEAIERAGYGRGPLVTDSQTFVTGFRRTADHRLVAGVTGGMVGFGGLRNARFEGRSAREADIRDSIRRAHPGLAEIPFADSWYGPIDRTRSGLPLFGRLPGHPGILYGYGFSGNGIATTPVAGRILASLALDQRDEWSGCGLVHPVEPWLPPEPVRYIGAHLVRAAVRRKDRLAHRDREPGPVARRLAALAPGGITTSRVKS
ncbi:MAG: FAD-binding oxidoreductase [Dongiaceae bacterium]